MRSLLRILMVAVALPLLLSACGSANSPVPTQSAVLASPTRTPSLVATASATSLATPATTSSASSLSGTWSGAWQNSTPNTAMGTFTLSWVQAGSSLSGTIDINDSTCVSTEAISGIISGNAISFGIVSGKVSYNGTVDGQSAMHGTYTAGPTCGDATGTWQATKQ